MTDPISVYGVHKLIVEKYHKLYSHHYGMEHVILRITNPYGPGQRKGARGYGIINLFINLAISGHTLSVYGDGSQLRDYIHINDVVEAFLTAGVHPRASGQTFNVGSGRSVSFLEMAKLVITLTNSGKITQVPWPESALKVETGDFYSDIASIQHILGWNPKISLEAGLRDAISRIKQ
jgi:nucleoside-diphosphate-sugar epimerase